MSPKITLEKLAEMIQAQFEFIEERFRDIESRMATKEDLKAFVTKDDLKAFATKEDLADGLSGVETKLLHRIDRLEDRLFLVERKVEHA